ncbi:hypothetical protein Sm713_33260 [Streptomyces sp. TS71-3]|nr:hypothetical protein Sm713_33260 [Streptomyces sp. TS71-3]
MVAVRAVPMRVGETEVLVETVQVTGTEQTSRVDEAVDGVREAFGRAQTAIVEVATSTVRMIEASGRKAARPDAVEVEFGLKFSAQGNVIVAGAAGEATLRVKLTYKGPGSGPRGGPDGTEQDSGTGADGQEPRRSPAGR